MDAWGSLLAEAARNHGSVRVRDGVALGIDARTCRRRFEREGWAEGPHDTWSPPGTELSVRGKARAATLAAGDHALVTGRTGLHLHGVDVAPEVPIRVVVPMAQHVVRHLDSEQIRVIASRTLRDEDARTVRRIPVAAPDRCFADLVLPPTPAVTPVRESLSSAMQKGLVDDDSLQALLARIKGMPGRPVLVRAVDDLGLGRSDSPFADRVLRRLMAGGFRPDRRPTPVEVPGRTLHPDITWSRARVCIECDGLRWHSEQRDVAIDDRKSRDYRAAGWNCFRIGWWEFDNGWGGFTNDLGLALSPPP